MTLQEILEEVDITFISEQDGSVFIKLRKNDEKEKFTILRLRKEVK